MALCAWLVRVPPARAQETSAEEADAGSERSGPDGDEQEGPERIIDPENPALTLPLPGAEESGAETEPGPEGLPTEPLESTGGGGRRAHLSTAVTGSYRTRVCLDTRIENTAEDVFLLQNRLELRARGALSEHLRAVLEGRLEHWLWGQSNPDGVDYYLNSTELQGVLEASLRDAYLSVRFENAHLILGNQTIVWGAGTLSQPGAVINPMDLRRGQLGTPAEARIPVVAAETTATFGRASVSGVLVPVFQPHRFDVRGNDFAVFNPARPPGVLTLYDTLLPSIDSSLEPVFLDLLAITERPEATLGNVSAGARLTASPGRFDIGLGYFYGWDRSPFLERGGRDNVEQEGNLTSRYLRLHLVEADLVAVISRLAIRLEVVYSPERSVYVEVPQVDLLEAPVSGDASQTVPEASRLPVLDAALALSYDYSEDLFLQLEAVWRQAFSEGRRRAVLFGGDDVGILGLAQLGLSELAALRDTFLSRLSLRVWGFFSVTRGDWILFPSVSWAFGEAAELTLGVNLFGGPEDRDELTLGGLYDENDQAVISFDLAF